jgi:hypothetical protein
MNTAWLARGALLTLLGLATASCTTDQEPAKPPTAAAEHYGWDWVKLDQGWSDEVRELFWNTSQGSQIIPYDWFLVLEQADGAKPFRDDANVWKYRFLPGHKSKLNPDGLPVGFDRDIDAGGQSWIGMTCAACHTGRIDFKGKAMLVEGGPTMADFTSFQDALVDALTATSKDEAKFDRFARAVLKQSYSPLTVEELRRSLTSVIAERVARNNLNRPPHRDGFARLDAFGAIFNDVAAEDLLIPANAAKADAPVSYPFLWDTPQSERVEWNGTAINAGAGPLIRNTGEVLGVFGRLALDPRNKKNGGTAYSSSARLPNLIMLEDWVRTLEAPAWPNSILPAVDKQKAERGKAHYDATCAQCHTVIDPKRKDVTVPVTMVAIDGKYGPNPVGTDPLMSMNALTRKADTGVLKGQPALVRMGDPLPATAPTAYVVVNAVAGAIFDQAFPGLDKQLMEWVVARNKLPPTIPAYRARPLDGIWATAPYLHNGSVPNLYQMLLPPEQRVKQFHVGNVEFDPVQVGFSTEPAADGASFLFDTAVPGNWNVGHDYSTRSLTDAQRWELIEYLKTL